jgi:hypothetical protein
MGFTISVTNILRPIGKEVYLGSRLGGTNVHHDEETVCEKDCKARRGG